MASTTLKELSGKTMSGKGELWLDPLGNEVIECDCTLTVDGAVVSYTWSYKGEPKEGRLELTDGGARWSDTWHQPEPMAFEALPGSWALLDARGTYPAGDGPDWGWRLTLSKRPTGQVVLQMTNITPWGEHGRAVRMTVEEA